MAKVKITGHASGTGVVTVTAPNTSTDRTITLPDATGTLLNSDGSGANLTNLPADATKLPLTGGAMTGDLNIDDASNSPTINFRENDSALKMKIGFGTTTTDVAEWNVSPAKDIRFIQNSTTNLTLKSDGRGLSQFTAKAWVRFDADGTFTVNDSHNISSVTDQGTGNARVNFDVDMANTNYGISSCGGGAVSNNTLICVATPQDGIATTHIELDTTYQHQTVVDAGCTSVMVFGD